MLNIYGTAVLDEVDVKKMQMEKETEKLPSLGRHCPQIIE